MNYILNSTIINSGSLVKNAVILCHGYGGDGKDISIVAHYWKNFLPDTLFVCPDAPEVCKVNPQGFQWFDLMDQTEDEILSKSLIAEKKLNKLIDEVKENNNRFAARKGVIGRCGPILVHIGLILLMIGAVYGSLGGLKIEQFLAPLSALLAF